MQQQSLFSNVSSAEKKPAEPRIYKVSELNAEFKFLLESTYPLIWVKGEISNFQQPTSGHYYFSLKDETSNLRVVMWKSSHRYLKWRPKNGMDVVVCGRVTVYEPKGEYQLEATQIIAHGVGDLFAAFEQLKEKLQKEGLFDQKRKRPLPLLPKKIGIVTSPTGAAIQDILHVLDRRYSNLHIVVAPAKVQGEEAPPTIVEALRALNTLKDIDVIILARGGGSLEDLWPFNDERVARAIVASRIPVISGVGHETDTTIADFAADLRAPTPSAAAEIVVNTKSQFCDSVRQLARHLETIMQTRCFNLDRKLNQLKQNRAFAGIPNRVHTYQQRVDDFEKRLSSGLTRYQQVQTRRIHQVQIKLNAGQLKHLVEVKKSRLNQMLQRLSGVAGKRLSQKENAFGKLTGMLNALSPLAVLERGYSISCKETGEILKDAAQTAPGENIQVRLLRGKLQCQVKEIENE